MIERDTHESWVEDSEVEPMEPDEIQEILEAEPDIIHVHKKDPELGKFGKIAGLKAIHPSDLKWDFLIERLPPGEYELVAYKQSQGYGQGIKKRKRIFLAAPYKKEEKKDNFPQGAFGYPPRDEGAVRSYIESMASIVSKMMERKEPAVNERFEGMIDGMGKALDAYTKLLPKPETPESIINQVRTLMEIQERMRPKESWVEQVMPFVQVIAERLTAQFQNRIPEVAKRLSNAPATTGPSEAPGMQIDFERIVDSHLEKYLMRAKRNEDPQFCADAFIADLEDLVQIGVIKFEQFQAKLKELLEPTYINTIKEKFPNIALDDIFEWLGEFRNAIKQQVEASEEEGSTDTKN